jgi:hypothetical protein
MQLECKEVSDAGWRFCCPAKPAFISERAGESNQHIHCAQQSRETSDYYAAYVETTSWRSFKDMSTCASRRQKVTPTAPNQYVRHENYGTLLPASRTVNSYA